MKTRDLFVQILWVGSHDIIGIFYIFQKLFLKQPQTVVCKDLYFEMYSQLSLVSRKFVCVQNPVFYRQDIFSTIGKDLIGKVHFPKRF